MPTTDVTVAYVNPPAEGKKRGTIKTTEGVYYGVWADKLSGFQKGKTYTIQYDEEEYNGRMYRSVKSNKGEVGGGSVNGKGGGDDPRRSEDIFVAGVVNNAIHGQGAEGIYALSADMVRHIREIYRAGEPATNKERALSAPDPQAPLNDEIPF